MQSKTSLSNGQSGVTSDPAQAYPRPSGAWFHKTLYRKNLARFWPVWTLYTVIWLFILPMQLAVDLRYHENGRNLALFTDWTVLNLSSAAILTAAIFGVLAAMCVFSYLYSSRSVGLYHSLPLRREGLFFTSYLSGLTFLAGPAVLVFLVTLVGEAAAGRVNAGALCMWLTVHLMCILFFYSFAVFCAMFTGNLLALPAFYGILNGLVAGLYGIVTVLLRQFVYGYAEVDWLQAFSYWLTPVAQLGSELRVVENSTVPYSDFGLALANGTVQVSFQGLHVAILYAVVGLLLTLCALVLYRRRRLESAGDVVSVGWVRPVFKYGVGVCAALVGGGGLYWSFFGGRTAYLPGILVWLLPCGAVGYFAAEMLLQKSFRVWGRWKGCVALTAGLLLAVGMVWLDPLGFTQWTPDPAQVDFVETRVSSYPSDDARGNLHLTEEADIALFIKAHADLIQAEEQWRNGLWNSPLWREGDVTLPNERTYSYQTAEGSSMRIWYQMHSGSPAWRQYDYLITEEDLADPDSYASIFQSLLNSPARRAELYPFPTADTARLVAGDVDILDVATGNVEQVTVPTQGLEALYAAVQSDLAAGRLGRRYLIEGQERMENCYYNDLTLGFYNPGGEDTYTQAYDEKYGPQATAMERSNQQVTITLQASATETLAVLEELGVIDENRTLTTWAEYRAQ